MGGNKFVLDPTPSVSARIPRNLGQQCVGTWMETSRDIAKKLLMNRLAYGQKAGPIEGAPELGVGLGFDSATNAHSEVALRIGDYLESAATGAIVPPIYCGEPQTASTKQPFVLNVFFSSPLVVGTGSRKIPVEGLDYVKEREVFIKMFREINKDGE